MNFLEHHTLFLTPISPIHVGCGDDYEPANYVIRDGFLYAFDPANLTLSPAERQSLLDACDRRGDDALRAIQRFFHDRTQSCIAVSHTRVSICPDVEAKYRSRVGQVAQREGLGRTVVNALSIARTASNPFLHQPILPGSSLKGAIRTAILDLLNDGVRLDLDKRNNRDFQAKLLGGEFSSDPMRLVKISDASGSIYRKILFQVNRRKKDSTAAQNQELFLECIAPERNGGLIAELSLQANPSRLGGAEKLREKCPAKSFDLATIAKACNRQASREIRRELSEGRRQNWFSMDWISLVESLLGSTAVQDGRAFLLRVGRHSGAESVTVAGVRRIRIMGKKGEQPRELDHALTSWLAAERKDQVSGLHPFGWLLVEVDSRLPELRTMLSRLPERAPTDSPANLSSDGPVPEQPKVSPPTFQPPNRLRHDSKDLPAVVIDATKKPCLVRFDWEGAPDGSFSCSGHSNAEIGQKLLVAIADMDKSKGVVRMVRCTRVF